MTSGFAPYASYKSAGVEELGEVPAHWEVRRLGQIGRLSKGSGGSKDDESPDGVSCIRYGDLYTAHDLFIRASRSFVSTDRAEDYTSIRFGDVLFAGSGETIDEIGKSAVNLMTEGACCGGDVILFRPTRQVDARFLGYATDCRSAAAQKATMGRGITVMHIYGSQLKRLALALPPLSEQAAIARFLDDADRRIQRAIATKEELIELLEEQERAVIQSAVAGQIDVRTGEPYPAYKDSGVSWIGDVPEHWPIVRLGRLFELRQEGGLVDLPILEVSLKTGVRVREFSGSHRKQVMDDRTAYQRAIRGDIAYNMMRMWQGAVGVVPEDGLISPAYVVAKPTSIANARYFSGLFRTAGFRRGIDMNSRGIVKDRNRLYWQDFKQLPAPCPPSDEQRSIVEHLEEATAKSLAAVEGARRQVELAQEYRTRLIADVVTGKLDVREAAARLPADEPPGVSGAGTGRHLRPPAAGGAGLKTGGPEEHGG